MARKGSLDGVQIDGGRGYMKEWGVEGVVRDGKVMEMGEGRCEIEGVVMGRELLG
ncbi:acyl-CoA dehydrogenase family protein [Bacillus altitudinis]|uniref:acyl-CoA dehydrogenase family protein n=1 Tax=Bacillus altitudinis TaxID=293387 RepID=UPI001F1A2C08|nr:acyl-CoA dehydrogenase family protein [Bacillus altitudinis]